MCYSQGSGRGWNLTEVSTSFSDSARGNCMNHARIISLMVAVLTLSIIAVGCSRQPGSGDAGKATVETDLEVPLLEGLYNLEFPITTKSERAQNYFNQGLVLTYGFDHWDAEQSFLASAREDPTAAMVYWGVAYVIGPNINAPMEEQAVARAYEYAQKAVSLSSGVSDKEKVLIDALSRRYSPEPVKDRSVLDTAYAEAMREAARRFPEDTDIGVLLAEALMDLHPWDYWTADRDPKPWTPEIQSVLASVLSHHPLHPLAHHLNIHLLENSPYTEQGIKSADVIRNLVPLSGHLVHMAGHAYFGAGLYHDCSLINEKAIQVDRTLISSFKTNGLYRFGYVPHNYHFLWACYAMEGRSQDAQRIAQEMADGIDIEQMRERGYGTLQHYWVMPVYSFVRFGRWDEILSLAMPDNDLPYPLGVWHYARGMAYARKGRFDDANAELKKLKEFAMDPALESLTIWDLNRTSDLLAIAVEVLAGELAAEQGRHRQAAEHLNRGIELEEGLTYDEPPPWYYPVRQSLGAVLLKMGRAIEAEKVYRRDLQRNPESGWSLFGLTESLRAQGKEDLVRDTAQRFRRAWARADILLKDSRF
jgi:tetratricopeptide (TPR) repeat protein